MSRKLFGTDGIRGTVGQTPITADMVLKLGHAVGRVLRQQTRDPQVLIGKDTRISGYMLESALESGLNSAGVHVTLLGPVPTPAVAYLTRAQRADLGIVISASHNAYPDNGIKFFSAAGSKLSDAWEQDVEAALAEPPQWVASAAVGRAQRLDDAAGRYIEFCKSTFGQELNLRNLKIVVDAANGAAYQIAPKVFHELGADVLAIGCTPDGLNINAGVGATHPGALVEAVRQSGAHYGVALDGDADRLQMVDSQGRLFNGDELLYVLAADRLAATTTTSSAAAPIPPALAGVVGTLMTNQGIELALRALGLDVVRARVGDRYVLEEMLARGWILGGESSGHLLVLDKHSTGDGLISALQVLRACVRAGKPLARLLARVELFPQVLINVRIPEGSHWQDNARLAEQTRSVQAELGAEGGRVLIRPSGTEPLLRVMVEARDPTRAQMLAQRLAEAATP
ncbi:MAG: phosphoglucosamine mutase [Burkholderiaceae bacterium]|jgi:phosphoglucosamine mutase|nr:phosphoglucosamine mutase [Burkholderiaceae bacterium]